MKEVTVMFDVRLPGQRVWVDGGGRFVFQDLEVGISPRGVSWRNVHLLHRENAAPWMRGRALPWLVGSGVDVGCGLEKIVPSCWGVDSGDDFGAGSDADEVGDGSDLSGHVDGKWDWLYSCNALEHIEGWERALSEWVRVVRSGGVLFLSMPWPERCYLHSVGWTPAHRWNPTPVAVGGRLEGLGVTVLECDAEADMWGCFTIIGRKG